MVMIIKKNELQKISFIFLKMESSDKKPLYYELYNDIVNFRTLTKEQLEKLNQLTEKEKLKLLLAYNDVIIALKEGEFI